MREEVIKIKAEALAAVLSPFDTLQVQYPILYLLCTTLIPELGSYISACTSCYKEVVLISVAAVRTFPYKLAGVVCDNPHFSIIEAFLTEVAFGI